MWYNCSLADTSMSLFSWCVPRARILKIVAGNYLTKNFSNIKAMPLVYEDILQICKDENDLRDFLIDKQLLGDFSGVCPHCSKGDLRLDADKSFSLVWEITIKNSTNIKTNLFLSLQISPRTAHSRTQVRKRPYYCRLVEKFVPKFLRIAAKKLEGLESMLKSTKANLEKENTTKERE